MRLSIICAVTVLYLAGLISSQIVYPGPVFSQEEKSGGGGGPGSHDAQYDRMGLTNLFSFVIFSESVMSNYFTTYFYNIIQIMFSNIKSM